MGFQKGVVQNPKGKPIGTKSKKTKQWEELSCFILNEGSERFIQELNKLEGVDYVNAFSKMIVYFKPKLANIDAKVHSSKVEPIKINIVKTYDSEGTNNTNEPIQFPKRV